MRDHGGDIDRARALHGGGDWLDLSTGINASPYPLPPMPERAWTALPTAEDIAALEAAARHAYGAADEVVALSGAQAAIQIVPRLRAPGRACVLAPSYNEHAAALRAQGWAVAGHPEPGAMAGADLAVVVNPNNPDGRCWTQAELLAVAGQVGLLVVDESFADPDPAHSLAALPSGSAARERVLVLRSFGKFYGLAGIRLGFVLCGTALAETVRALAGPWAVSGPAIAIGRAALSDALWRERTRARLARDAARLDALAARAGWRLVGGTDLFRTYETGNAAAARDRLARAKIWTRAFPYSAGWLRLGLPGTEPGWARLKAALTG